MGSGGIPPPTPWGGQGVSSAGAAVPGGGGVGVYSAGSSSTRGDRAGGSLSGVLVPMGLGGGMGEILPAKVGLGVPVRVGLGGSHPVEESYKGWGSCHMSRKLPLACLALGVQQQQQAVAHAGKVLHVWVSHVTPLTCPHHCPPQSLAIAAGSRPGNRARGLPPSTDPSPATLPRHLRLCQVRP